MKYLVVTIFILAGFLARSQQVIVEEIRETDTRFKDRNNSFPFVHIPNNVNATNAVNIWLQKDVLDIDDTSIIRDGIFKNVNPGGIDGQSTLSNISFEVICNKNRLFSLAISATSCGAYCEDFTNYYTFDTRGGSIVRLDTLIRTEFKSILLDSINACKKSILLDKIAWINDTLMKTHHWIQSDDSSYYTNMRDLYQQCLENVYYDLSFYRFYIDKKELYIELDRCSTHADRNIDELDAFKLHFALGHWKEKFTEYGLSLIQ